MKIVVKCLLNTDTNVYKNVKCLKNYTFKPVLWAIFIELTQSFGEPNPPGIIPLETPKLIKNKEKLLLVGNYNICLKKNPFLTGTASTPLNFKYYGIATGFGSAGEWILYGKCGIIFFKIIDSIDHIVFMWLCNVYVGFCFVTGKLVI